MAASMLPSHLQGLQAALAVGVIVLTIKANEEAFLSFGEVPFFFLSALQAFCLPPCFEGSIVFRLHDGYFN